MTSYTITFEQTVYQLNFTQNASTSIATLTAPIQFDGSDGSGSDGETGRVFTHSTNINANARVYIGSLTLERLEKSQYSISGTDLTINVAVYDSEKIEVDSS